jgi:O-antigen/teichoic acid export membrane protein
MDEDRSQGKEVIKKRMLSAISGNVLVQGINAIIQLAGIPLLLKFWGVHYYGEWLLLFTIPAYIGMSDMGLGSSTTSELSMLVEAKMDSETKSILRNAFWFILIVGGIPFVLLASSIWVLPWYDWLNFSVISDHEFKPAFFFLILYVYLALFLTLPLGFYRVHKIYHRERFISSFFRVVEFVCIIVAVMAGFGILTVAIIYFLVRLIQLVFVLVDLTRKYDTFRLFPFGFDYKKIRHLLKPGLSAMTIYMGQNLMIQGLVSIIGIGLGSAQVVLFSTTRTLVNMVKQVVGIINLSVTSEFSYAYGARNAPLVRKLFRLANRSNALIAIALLTGLFFFGKWIFTLWTSGEVDIVEPFYLFFLLSTFVGAMWNVHLVLLVATNRLGKTGILFLIAAFCLVAINAFYINHIGISGVSLSILCFELIMLGIMMRATKPVLNAYSSTPLSSQ